MKSALLDLIIEFTPLKIQNLFIREYNEFAALTYAQEGEDILIDRIFGKKSNGFYVDVGAFHPKFISNTYLFYRKGWRGINIDARPGSMKDFDRVRPRDINIEVPISEKQEVLTYYFFNNSELNGFVKEMSTDREKNGWGKIIKEQELKSETLSNILDKHLPVNQEIDFMSIDVEGLDFEVLKSNNWTKYKPKAIIIEDLENLNVEQIHSSEINRFLIERGYLLHSKLHYSQIYLRSE